MHVRLPKKFLMAALVLGAGAAVALIAAPQQPATAGGQGDVNGRMRIDHFLPATIDPAVDPATLGNPEVVFNDALRPDSQTTVQWGWLDPRVPPKLRMHSGETVAIETMMHSHNLIQPGKTMDDIVNLRLANRGGGPHTVTGPIWVEEADPGEVMEIRIKKIVTKGFGTNFNLPGSQFPGVGALNDLPEFQTGFVKYFFFEPDQRRTEFKPGVNINLKPFPGTLAVGIDPNDPSGRRGPDTIRTGVLQPASVDPLAPVSTLRPWKNGSNMDLNELGEGSTVYIPIFLRGGLIWTGDSHCRQGNGEINLTALECSYDHIVLEVIVREDMHLEWPMAETKTHWILMGFDEDLDKAFKIAAVNTVEFLKSKGFSAHEAYSLTSMIGDCRVTQVVDIRKGVHCMVPKSLLTGKGA